MTMTPTESRRHGEQRALVLFGDGLGNMIEQTILLQAVCQMYRAVDVWTPKTPSLYHEIFRNFPHAVRLFGRTDLPFFSYDVVYSTSLTAEYVSRVKTTTQRVLPKFNRHVPQPEGVLFYELAVQDGFVGAMPRAYCGHVPVDSPVRGKPLIGFVSGSKGGLWLLKRYHRFAETVDMIRAEYPDAAFMTIGEDTDDCVVHTHVKDVRGLFSFSQTLGLLRRLDLLLATDTGLAHAAAAMQVPTVVLFGPTNIVKNLPAGAVAVSRKLPCMPCQYRSSKLGYYPGTGNKCRVECLTELSPTDVTAAALDVLRAR